MNTNSNMTGIGYRMIRRAMHLRHAMGAYRSSSADARTLLDYVALIVTPEEYAELKNDPELWANYSRGDAVLDWHVPMEGASEIRLCGILVLPHE